jgi:hypothetical protein
MANTPDTAKPKWGVYKNSKGDLRVFSTKNPPPKGWGKAKGTSTYKTKANAANQITRLRSASAATGGPARAAQKALSKAPGVQPTYGDIIKKLGGNAAKFAKYALRATGAGLALEAAVVALGKGQGLTPKQKEVFKAAGIPLSRFGGESQRVFTEQSGSIERAKERQANRDAAKKKKAAAAKSKALAARPDAGPTGDVGDNLGKIRAVQSAKANRERRGRETAERKATAAKLTKSRKTEGIGAAPYGPKSKATPKRDTVEDIPGIDTGKKAMSEKTIKDVVAPSKSQLKKRAADKLEQSRKTEGIGAAPYGPKSKAKPKTTKRQVTPSGVSPELLKVAPGSRAERVTAAPPKLARTSRAGEPIRNQGAFDLINPEGWKGHRPQPFSSGSKRGGQDAKPVRGGIGDFPGKKGELLPTGPRKAAPPRPRAKQSADLPVAEGFIAAGKTRGQSSAAKAKEAYANEAARRKQRDETRTKALYHGASQADASAGGDFGKLGGLPRRPIPRPQPEFSKKKGPGATKKTKAPTPSQEEDISGAIKELRAAPGGERKRVRKPAADLGRRGRKYEATDMQEREWERMQEEAEQYARKGGKITKKKAVKKSSTSNRSRPKNPTLQKTSYNY